MSRRAKALPLRRARWGLAAVMWAVAGTMALSPVGAPHAVAADTGSAVTVSGTGPFSSLKVTVSQTQNLIDQVVHVTWTGATPTVPGFKADYLQIMQCWSDKPTGPDRTQCEFGNSGDTRGGDQVASRQLDVGTTFADPAETQVATVANPYNQVPFESASWTDDSHTAHPVVGGEHAELGQFFDNQSTNEQPFSLTGADGTGESFFETLTAQEAPGLGCGSSTTDGTGAPWSPHCWLVIVPRGETEVTGAPYTDHGTGLVTSPLSATNWAQRLVVPLGFNPLAISCPIGSPEQPTSGQEIVQEALSGWQGELCKQSGTVYSYSKGSDDASRRQLSNGAPGLDFLTQPQPPTARGASDVVYAPVAVSGAVIAFNIDYSAYGSTALKPLAGQRVPQINLTPRLVAKLITQSYQGGAPIFDPPLYANTHQPAGLTSDPDFFSVNPGLTGLNNGGGDVLMPFTPSDLIQELWTWVNADPQAKAFLDGAPDPWGMTVNPAYVHVTDSTVPSSFPKSDTYCATPTDHLTYPAEPDWCTLDVRPYANDLHDAARAASRGDTLNRSLWDGNSIPPHFVKAQRQIAGQQSVMAFTDAATAARYSLSVARLQNASGQFVAPDAAGLAAGVAALKPSGVPGVAVPDPATSNPDAYPLTSITYAATIPRVLSSQARADYADFIQYAVTAGQAVGGDIGQLPVGYLPLPHALVTQALTTSVGLRTYVSPAPTPTPAAPTTSAPSTRKPSPTPTKRKPTKPPVRTTPPTPPTTRAPSPTPPATGPTFVVPPPVTPVIVPTTVPATTAPPTSAAAVTSAGATTSQAPSPTPTSPSSAAPSARSVADVTRTPGVPTSSTRYAFIVVLAIGGLCALSGPGLLRWGSRRAR